MQSSEKSALGRADLEKRELSMKENFAEIVDLITTVEQVAINERIEAGTKRELNITDVRIWELKEVCNSDFNIYCDKTGNKLGRISDDEIDQLLATHNIERASELVKITQRNRIDPNWIFTDPKSLDALSETDPIGYFVHAASLVLRIYQPYWQGKDKHDADANDKWRKDKADLNANLQHVFKEHKLLIIEINELMRRYLTLMQTLSAINQVKFTAQITSLPFLYDELPTFKRALIASIEAVIEHEYRQSKIKSHLTYADIVQLNIRYKGYSNFRGQKTLKGMSDMDHILAIVEEFTPKINSVQEMILNAKVEEQLQERPQVSPAIKHEAGTPIAINIPEPKQDAIKLSFAQILQQKVK